MPKKRPPSKKHKQRQQRQARRKPAAGSNLPPVCVLEVTDTSRDGELLAAPANQPEHKKPPHIIVTAPKSAKPGDRVLAKLTRIRPHYYEAAVMRILPSQQPKDILGMFVATEGGGIIEPISRKEKDSYFVTHKDSADATHGELVRATSFGGQRGLKMPSAKIDERLGTLDSPRAASLIATHLHGLPTRFSEAALAEAEEASSPVPEKTREDLRKIPLVTIDGEDARDFDDAVFAEATKDGFHLIVAIADVAHYVKEDSALDKEAHERGNSVYFPDRVIPMLPEKLSNGLCSLKPDEDRYCLAVHLWIDTEGNRTRYQFVRGIMRSHYRFTYEEIQAAQASKKHRLYKQIIQPLYAAYAALSAERDRRGPLALSLPEYKIQFDKQGHVSAIMPKPSLESHRLIESFMIAANVAAADFLLKKKSAAIYRVHDHPDDEKLEELRQFVKLAGYSLQKGAITATHLNRVLKKSAGQDNQFVVHMAVLRGQMQAYYSPHCDGHFGLSLTKYCHFTSPIRRYADLVVHRSLICCLQGQVYKLNGIGQIAEHISDTERVAMQAERDAADRYRVAYMQDKQGESFHGMIAGLNAYGLFIDLHDNGVTGFVPARSLPNDFYLFDKKRGQFKGRRSKRIYQMGQAVRIIVEAANSMTGSLIFSLAEEERPASRLAKRKRPHKSKKGKKRPKRAQ